MSDTGSVNKVFILGALGRDPEIKTMQSGEKIANMSVATSESWKDKSSGERREKTEWHRVSVFNQHLIPIIENYLKKGTRVHLEGQVQTRKWTGRDGEERFSTEVVLPKFGGSLVILDSRQGASQGDSGYQERQPTRTDPKGNPQYGGSTGGAGYDDGGEIPFGPEWR